MNPRAVAANLVWAGSSLQPWWRFRRALAQPEHVQQQLLVSYLRQNVDTVFGREHRFDRILNTKDIVQAYRDTVPLTDYDALEPSILKIGAGERNVLTTDPVRRLTPSSGSTSAVKLLPHTDCLQREFARAVDAWIADLFVNRPRLAAGPAYWSITPSVSFETTAATRMKQQPAIPIGC